jgi:hypothetical protein
VDPYLCEIACGQELAASLDLPGCVPAQIDLITCLAELDCEALAETTADPASPHCAEVRALADEVCDPTCTVASSMTNVEAMTCSAVFSCGATERAVDCVAEACTCTLDGEVVGSCVGEPDCAWFGETMGAPYWMELGVSCCGFPGPSR